MIVHIAIVQSQIWRMPQITSLGKVLCKIGYSRVLHYVQMASDFAVLLLAFTLRLELSPTTA